MRFKPWMLAPKSRTKKGPWSALPPPVLAALTSTNQNPMVRGYLVNGTWPGLTGTKPALVAPEPDQEAEPKLPREHTSTDQASSLSLTIRVVQPTEGEPTLAESPLQQSTWRRFLQVIKGKAA